MNALHEAVEMHPLLARYWQMLVKKIHQPGFTATHAAPDVEAASIFGMVSADPVQDRMPALPLQGMPQAFQCSDNTFLVLIGNHVAVADKRAVAIQRGLMAQNGGYGVSGWLTGFGNWLRTPFLSRPRRSIRRRWKK